MQLTDLLPKINLIIFNHNISDFKTFHFFELKPKIIHFMLIFDFLYSVLESVGQEKSCRHVLDKLINNINVNAIDSLFENFIHTL